MLSSVRVSPGWNGAQKSFYARGTIMNVTVLKNPVVGLQLRELRDKDTQRNRFCELIELITTFLVYEAASDLPTQTVQVLTPTGEEAGCVAMKGKVGLVPILRAGIGMSTAASKVLPGASVFFLGYSRNDVTLQPEAYYERYPEALRLVDVCFILDVMLATGGSAAAAVRFLKSLGIKDIRLLSVIAAPEGVRHMNQVHPDVPIIVATLDRCLNSRGYILPGLGDAGDRQFGT
jgi:uracil phosphoribosyltransferase